MPVFLPLDQSVSFTQRILGTGFALGVLAWVLGAFLRIRWVRQAAGLAMGLVALCWLGLRVTRPAWLRIALQGAVPAPAATPLEWVTRAPGVETADLDLSVEGQWVDHVALVRLDPGRCSFRVHHDESASRDVVAWQRALGATVVVNGSYFYRDGTPATPLRSGGRSLGPRGYASNHGAFLARQHDASVLDLRGADVDAAIGAFPEAMVSYPLLVDGLGHPRAQGHPDWLASRTFVVIDPSARIILGTTRTGFFSLARLGAFLRQGPLEVQLALNFDGGPLASQIVTTGNWERVVTGSAEINHGTDVLRAFWQGRRTSRWKLPIVLAADCGDAVSRQPL
jgi:hypothetical protein